MIARLRALGCFAAASPSCWPIGFAYAVVLRIRSLYGLDPVLQQAHAVGTVHPRWARTLFFLVGIGASSAVSMGAGPARCRGHWATARTRGRTTSA